MPAIIRYNPWTLLRGIQDDINQIFERNDGKDNNQWNPHVDIVESKEKYTLTADLPGVDPQAVKISMEGNVLTISGERKYEQKINEEGYSRMERSYGSFTRQFTLPDNVLPEKISAKSKNGVLELMLPKKEAVGPKKLDIRIEEEK